MTSVTFPRTPHVAWQADRPIRDDKLLSEAEVTRLLSGRVVVEEKIDGDNLSFAVVGDHLDVQHRGTTVRLSEDRRFPFLSSWMERHQAALVRGLEDRRVLFGEWCAAEHSVHYKCLPDWFLAFDIFDIGAAAFWSADRRDAWCGDHGIAVAPRLAAGSFDLGQLSGFLGQSLLGPGPGEGIIVRREIDGFLEARAKLVRRDHVQAGDEHWRRRSRRLNHRAPDIAPC